LYRKGQDLAGRVWHNRRAEWIANTSSAAPGVFDRHTAASEAGLGAAVAAPLDVDGGATGVIIVYFAEPKPADNGAADLAASMIEPIAALIFSEHVDVEFGSDGQNQRIPVEMREQAREAVEEFKLADRFASLGTLASGLGHDLNNLLFPLRCRLDSVRSRVRSPRTHRELSEIRETLDRLQQLADGLRLLSPRRANATEPRGVTLVDDWWAEIRPVVSKLLPRGAHLEVDLPEESLPAIGLSPYTWSQAFLNLVINAGEAIEPNGRVSVRFRVEEAAVWIEIADDGRGMPPEVRRQLWDPYFTTKTRGLSTGLGLAVVRQIIDSVAGSIVVRSTPGGGTTVAIRLPIIDPNASEDGRGAPEARDSVVISVSDSRTAAVATTLLRAAGFDVQPHGEPLADRCMVWITDPPEDTSTMVSRFLDENDRRQVVIAGASIDGVDRGRIMFADPAQGLQSLRVALGNVVRNLKGRSS
jgi:signal transduction histidine kinase